MIIRALKPVSIGPIRIDNPIVLAPMSGVTDMPYRRLVKRHGAGLVVSEMIASRATVIAARKAMKKAIHTAEEYPASVQLAGCDPKVMAEAAQLHEQTGAAIIDINMGCPAKKVTNGYAGSALMQDECKAAKIMEAVVKSVKLPVTLKMRTGWDDSNRNAPTLARIAQDCGIKALSVHGRTRCQFYKGRSDWSFIGEVKSVVGIPVFGNGDVNTEEDAQNLLQISGVDGIMIGRGTYGRPWFLEQVRYFLDTGQKRPAPALQAQCDIVIEHFDALLSHYGVQAGLKIARKHLGWYSKGLPNAAVFRGAVFKLTKPHEVRRLLSDFYVSHTRHQAA